jgi:hypothetical protein
VFISLDYPSHGQKARLLLCPCAGTEIAQPSSRRRRLGLGPNEACAVAMVPNMSKESTAVFKDWRMQS